MCAVIVWYPSGTGFTGFLAAFAGFFAAGCAFRASLVFFAINTSQKT